VDVEEEDWKMRWGKEFLEDIGILFGKHEWI